MSSIIKKIASRSGFKNIVFTLKIDKVSFPNGQVGEYAWAKINRGGVAIVAIDENGNVVLLENYRYPIGRTSLEIPQGGLGDKFSSMPLEVAKQELKEEAGFVGRKWEKLGHVYTAPFITDDNVHIFLTQQIKKTNDDISFNEAISKVKLVSVIDVQKLISDGEIAQALTIASLHLAFEKLKNYF